MSGGTRAIRRLGRPLRTLGSAFAALAALALPVGGATAAEPLEWAVKATYLYKLVPFVDWPPGSLGPPGQPFEICIIGHDPFGPLLERAVAGQQAAGRPITVRRLPALGAKPDAPCAIAYLGGGAAAHDALKGLGAAPILTVTDGVAGGGVIDFVLDQGRVRFRIDEAQAQARHLTLGSPLLGLAVSVNRGAGARP